MQTAMKTTELASYLAKLICEPGRMETGDPAWEGGHIYITNGHIGIQIKCDEPIDSCSFGMKWIAALKPQLEDGDPADIVIPNIKPLSCWKDPYKQIESICSACDGDGLLECNLGHEHECEACDGTGKATSDWVSEYYYGLNEDQTQYQIPGVGWFDRRYLWIISEIQKDISLAFSTRKGYESKTLLFSGDGIKGVLMVQKRYGRMG